MGKWLTSRNLRMLTADNGTEALEKLQQTHEIDLVLLDIKMPEMDGINPILVGKIQFVFY
jgi:CheY-like chemotaxis protein